MLLDASKERKRFDKMTSDDEIARAGRGFKFMLANGRRRSEELYGSQIN